MKRSLKRYNKRKKFLLQFRPNDRLEIDCITREQRACLHNLQYIYAKRKQFDVQRVRHACAQNPIEIYKMINSSKGRFSGNPKKMKIRDKFYRGEQQVEIGTIEHFNFMGSDRNKRYIEGFNIDYSFSRIKCGSFRFITLNCRRLLSTEMLVTAKTQKGYTNQSLKIQVDLSLIQL